MHDHEGSRMANFHMIVGSLVVVGFVITLILNVRTAITGAEFSWQRMVSMGSATLLLVQYVLGFSLLGSDGEISGYHYILALAAILPVGFEHAYAGQQATPQDRGKLGALANAVTLVLVLVAYMIGQSN
jgi:hypothetical protein